MIMQTTDAPIPLSLKKNSARAFANLTTSPVECSDHPELGGATLAFLSSPPFFQTRPLRGAMYLDFARMVEQNSPPSPRVIFSRQQPVVHEMQRPQRRQRSNIIA